MQFVCHILNCGAETLQSSQPHSFRASPEVGEVSRSDGEVETHHGTSLHYCHTFFCSFKHERVVVRISGIGFDNEINDVVQSFCRR